MGSVINTQNMWGGMSLNLTPRHLWWPEAQAGAVVALWLLYCTCYTPDCAGAGCLVLLSCVWVCMCCLNVCMYASSSALGGQRPSLPSLPLPPSLRRSPVGSGPAALWQPGVPSQQHSALAAPGGSHPQVAHVAAGSHPRQAVARTALAGRRPVGMCAHQPGAVASTPGHIGGGEGRGEWGE